MSNAWNQFKGMMKIKETKRPSCLKAPCDDSDNDDFNNSCHVTSKHATLMSLDLSCLETH
jgi:hypothetical protein